MLGTFDYVASVFATPEKPFRRQFPVPLGSTLVALIVFPFAFLAFLPYSIVGVSKVFISLMRLIHRKYYEYSQQKYNRTADEGCAAPWLVAPFNWYFKYWLVTELLLLLLWPLVLLLHPIAGTLHSMFEAAKQTYRESNTVEEGVPPEGLFHGAYDAFKDTIGDAVYGEDCKERCSEALGAYKLGAALLWVGDYLLLTGMADGLWKVQGVLKVHRKIFGVVTRLLDWANWAESASVLGVDVDVMPFELIFKRFPSTVKKKRKALMEEADEEEVASKSAKKQALAAKDGETGKKKCRPANVYGAVSFGLALTCWLGLGVWSQWPAVDDAIIDPLQDVFTASPPPAFFRFG